MRRSVLLASVLLALAGGMVACSNKTNGSPLPGDPTGGETTTGQTPRTTRPTTSTGSGDSPLADKEPCSLLTDSAKSQLGLSGAGEERKVGSARTCRWRLRGPSETFIFDVVVVDKGGIKDLPADTNPKSIPDVGGHQAVQVTDPNNPGVCSVIMGVTESSRAGATVVAGEDVQKGCELALQMAKLVEPELP